MKKYLHSSIMVPAFILLFFVLYAIEAIQLGSPVANGVLTESFFPLLISIVGAGATIKLLIDGLKKGNENTSDEKKVFFTKKVIAVIALTFLFTISFSYLGFTISTPIYVFCLSLLFDDKVQHIVKKIIVTLLIVAFVYVLYEVVFQIRFPEIWS